MSADAAPPTILAILPARGGSKGLPRKNVLPLSGIPLIAHSIRAARACPLISRTLVTTDDAEIERVAVSEGAEVLIRPAELAQDLTPTEPVVRHVLETLRARSGYQPDFLVLLQPTSPLRTSRQIEECIRLCLFHRADLSLSVCESEHHPYKSFRLENDRLTPLFGAEELGRPRQSLPKVVRQNGAIYVMRTEVFLQARSFFVPGALPYLMKTEDSVDIDTSADLALCEILLNRSLKSGAPTHA